MFEGDAQVLVINRVRGTGVHGNIVKRISWGLGQRNFQ